MKKATFLLAFAFFVSCKTKTESIKPEVASVSESIYASGTIKSKNQYEAYSTVNGIISNILVSEGDSVKVGTPILTISNEAQKLSKENAELAAQFADFAANKGKLDEAKLFVELSRNKMKLDSSLLSRQQSLWRQQIGTKTELEQRELAYQNSKTSYYSSVAKYNDLKRQLSFTSSQSQKNLQISSKQERDFTLKSEIDGIVYSLQKKQGELVGLQTPLAVIGNPETYILEMQVDEYDIFKVKVGLNVLVTMDAYKGQVFEATITKVYPIMKERSKSFLVEAVFTKAPPKLYPFITFEANIVLQTKKDALLIPRNYLVNDSTVLDSKGKEVRVKTGLKDYQKIEILSGITAESELTKPAK
jgi:HlyD family secretion protein